ncbi:uncharacterized protein METZ01_LOCUS462832 [marine metagenome]|uniref:HhH-GPD domain-containing protein n=1 Tax=marine metagenome TaxID=408172 RepID=A0A383AS69_9ZZZZ
MTEKSKITHLIEKDPKLGKFIVFFTKKNFTISDDYRKSTEFLSLVRTIIGQQLSINVASSIYNKFIDNYGSQIYSLQSNIEVNDLKTLGLSKAKSETIIKLSYLINEENLNLTKTMKLPEQKAKDILCKIKGIGPWTVENFLLFSGKNQDICPINDLGIKKGIQIIYNLNELPSEKKVMKISSKWKPYRSLASRYLWEIVDQDINFL